MLKIGKKTRAWLKAKPKLIDEYLDKNITSCEISNSKYALSFHHIDKRSSLKAVHTFEGTRLLNQDWHDFCERNKNANELLRKKPRGFDKKYFNMFKKLKEEKKTLKKLAWQVKHQCINCKQIASMLLCEHCGKLSIKS